MKKTFFLAGIVTLLFSLAVNAQQDTTKQQQDTTKQQSTQPQQQDTTKQQQATKSQQQQTTQTQDTTKQQQTTQSQQQQTTQSQQQPVTQEQKKYGNPTVDSILSKYTLAPMPNQMTTEQIFPVIGQYQSTSNADQKVTVTLDDQNKGFAWIEGLPQGKVKAVLKKSPATYKIPAQKTAEGTDVPEGTMIYDKDSKTLSIVLGRDFNDQDPGSVFATATTTTDQSMTNDQTTTDQAMTNNKGNNESKMNDQGKTSQAKTTVTKTKGNKTKTKVKKAPEPWVFTGTKIEQVTAQSQNQQ